MAAFLAGKLVREKNGRFEGHGWEKEVEICGKEGKDINMSESFEIVESAKTSFLSWTWQDYSQSRGNLNRCDGPFLLNEHGDLYFLLHKNIVHIIFLNLEKK